jgi:hypothetical protein
MNERVFGLDMQLWFLDTFPATMAVLLAAGHFGCREQSSVMMSPRCLARFRFEVCHPHKDVWLFGAGRFWLPDADPLGLDIIV